MNVRVYRDPCRRIERPSLLGGLTRVSATTKQLQAEDQLTEAIAWLADRSEAFARELVTCFVSGDDEALHALSLKSTVGARTQVHLPAIDRGLLRADLSLSGCDQSFELLVEAKLTAKFHQSIDAQSGNALPQPDAYLLAWRQCDPDLEARVRRVGTLTVDGKAPRSDDPWRARDVTWQGVHDVLSSLLAADLVESDVRLFAEDIRDFLGGRILRPVVPAGFLDWGARLTRAVVGRLAALSGADIGRRFAANEDFSYAGGYLKLPGAGANQEWLWFVVVPAGGDYNVPGAPAMLWITDYNEEPLSVSARSQLLNAGFQHGRERIGYQRIRTGLPVSEIEAESTFDDQVDFVSEWAADRLREAGLIAR